MFTAPGCAVARSCWCMYYRESGRVEAPAGQTLAQARKRRLRALVASNAVPGLLACREGAPVGWVCLGSRGEFAKLRRSSVLRPVDDEDVWSIVCFVVPSAHRHHGVARALLQGAMTYAATRGARLLEAYPVDKPGPAKDDALWFGTKSMYDRAGFVEVARRKPGRPIVRKRLRARRPASAGPATIAVRNVNLPGSVTNVSAGNDAAMREALLAALPRRGPGLTQAQLVAAIVPRLPQRLWPGGAKARWWIKTVQLDLEARGLVVRDTASRPLRWRRA